MVEVATKRQRDHSYLTLSRFRSLPDPLTARSDECHGQRQRRLAWDTRPSARPPVYLLGTFVGTMILEARNEQQIVAFPLLSVIRA